jgi:hypothetical protein
MFVMLAATKPTAVPTVQVQPDPAGLPGSNVLQELVNGLAFWMLMATIAGILIGAGVWALSAHSNNHHWASKGRTGTLAAACGALIVGAASALVNFFVDLGSKVK